ncbi:GNAT family N-acetyltransferase [Streptomyces sp. NBC_00102]|uniref:GNAT family N-acetyltransferase n=1 Tax=Streptomyces sp. NBC_00102 TaxID=2975652 RepID=UPI0022551120|nr:GNAT family N-acetyltransferase [Streptomyces sp. NBC_00102]MCX5397770.1 GNAT family N-acetyltransferase [Streptomyces sp. NBC_00102]
MSLRITPLTEPDHGPSSHRLVWLAEEVPGDGTGPAVVDRPAYPVGSASLRLFTDPGRAHLAELDLAVHPSDRRAGIGTRLLDAALAGARAEGRTTVTAQVAMAGGAEDEYAYGAAFLTARGFRAVLTLTFTRLATADVDPAARTALAEIAAEPHPGYRLTAWNGTVPDELAETFARSRWAMDDMPMDEMDPGAVVWDVDRVRAVARAVEQRGELLHTVAAVDEADGTIVGFTELVVPGDGKGDGLHYGTGVLPAHRGRGLARWMKAESIRTALTTHPGLAGLVADTADSNTPMRAVNDALGYVPTHRAVYLQRELGEERAKSA